MRRFEQNRSGEMEVFVRVIERGGFSAAARELRRTPSAVSKMIARLEERLGARLLNRSNRSLQLTPEGQRFYQRCVTILSDLDEAEVEAGRGTIARGTVRVNANVPFGIHYLLPLVPSFRKAYPEVTLDISLSDVVVDLYEERADVAIRVGPLRPSRLLAKKLGVSTNVLVASPAYLKQHGTPRSLEALSGHDRIAFSFPRTIEGWPFQVDDRTVFVPVRGTTLVSDGECARNLAIAGMGIARLGLFHTAADIQAGRLQVLLDHLNPGDADDIHAVYIGQGGHLPARIRAFIDFLASHLKLP